MPNARVLIGRSLEETDKANARLQKLETQTRKDIEDLAKAYSGHKSSVLVGIAGGIVGTFGGFTIATSTAVIAVTGPLGAAFGVALAVLAWRGPTDWKLERETEKVTKALDLYYKELNRIPKNAPQYIRDNYWKRYDELMSKYASIIQEVIGETGDNKLTLPSKIE